jgi:hypothetical protein
MFDSYELPQPDEIAGLSDAGLFDAMTMATLMETAAIEVRLAAIEEICVRQLRAPATTRPTPPRPQAALQRPSRRRRRTRRKRRNRH